MMKLDTFLKQSNAHYNENAEAYASFVDDVCPDFNKVHANTLSHLKGHGVDLEQKVVVDYGAGEGRDVAHFTDELDCNVMGIEPSKYLRAIAEERCPNVVIDESKIPLFMHGQVDIIWSSAVMQHMDHDGLLKFWSQARDWLKVGGWLVITRRLTPYSPDEIGVPRPHNDWGGYDTLDMRSIMRRNHMEGIMFGFSERTLAVNTNDNRDITFVTHIIKRTA